MFRRAQFLALFLALLTVVLPISPISTNAELPPLIPRDLLLGNPERANPHISPAGKKLAWLAPDAHGVLQVWVETIGNGGARAVTADMRCCRSTFAVQPASEKNI